MVYIGAGKAVSDVMVLFYIYNYRISEFNYSFSRHCRYHANNNKSGITIHRM